MVWKYTEDRISHIGLKNNSYKDKLLEFKIFYIITIINKIDLWNQIESPEINKNIKRLGGNIKFLTSGFRIIGNLYEGKIEPGPIWYNMRFMDFRS